MKGEGDDRVGTGHYGEAVQSPEVLAGALLSALPVIVVFVILQRQFVEGVASTGIKG
jgi:ABC-type glycerol-3-phosphate transport system permease component